MLISLELVLLKMEWLWQYICYKWPNGGKGLPSLSVSHLFLLQTHPLNISFLLPIKPSIWSPAYCLIVRHLATALHSRVCDLHYEQIDKWESSAQLSMKQCYYPSGSWPEWIPLSSLFSHLLLLVNGLSWARTSAVPKPDWNAGSWDELARPQYWSDLQSLCY